MFQLMTVISSWKAIGIAVGVVVDGRAGVKEVFSSRPDGGKNFPKSSIVTANEWTLQRIMATGTYQHNDMLKDMKRIRNKMFWGCTPRALPLPVECKDVSPYTYDEIILSVVTVKMIMVDWIGSDHIIIIRPFLCES